MNAPTMITGICPKCRKTIQIPQDLEQFSCVYCGSRLEQGQLLSEIAPQPVRVDSGAAQAAYERLSEGLLPCITDNLGVFKNLSKSGFPVYFDAFAERYHSLLELIPAASQASPDALSRIAERLAADIDCWSQAKRKALTSRDAMRDDAKYTLCLLLIPAIRKLNLNKGEEFCALLRKKWMERFPKSPFQLTTYEDIMSGFKRKLCFITTAVCLQAGKPDDCPELTAFRSFRDGYLLDQPDGEALISRYYETAPAIVLAIDLMDDPDTVYPAIWDRYLAPCYDALNRGDYKACKTRYTDMVRELSEKYLRS